MKKENAFRKLLGITQDDMALLLRVSRSQWSMYELGKRDLPAPNMILLAQLLEHLNKTSLSNKALPEPKNDKNTVMLLEQLQSKNEYQQMLISKKIAAAERKYIKSVRQLQVADFLARRQTNKQEANDAFLKTIAGKASKALEEDGLAILIQYKLKQELLIHEEQLLQSNLLKLRT